MSEELKPCPFCGEVPPSPKHYMMDDYWYTACTTEWHPVIEFRARTRVDLIAAWNRRSDSDLAAEKSAREKAEAALKDKVEVVAEECHRQWSVWTEYFLSKLVKREDGAPALPEAFIERWRRQINTPYLQLSEDEKESDRIEARGIIAALAAAQAQEKP